MVIRDGLGKGTAANLLEGSALKRRKDLSTPKRQRVIKTISNILEEDNIQKLVSTNFQILMYYCK